MYDDRQHRDLFFGPGKYLFRGTLPSSAFSKPYQGLGVTPTSTDPIVATLFACRYRMMGSAVVLLALKSEFIELLDGPNLTSFYYECAVNLELPPDKFEMRCQHSISIDDSLAILEKLGYRLPSKLPDLSALTQSPRMLADDIERCLQRARGG